ncbi:MAG: DUF3179 domain-containing protein [SAR202 cluster bacterium]|nr:DUF3179 domain-containing protein [SAR202 cluster bacterium]
MVGTRAKLEVLPMNLTIWPKWLAKHPDTTVRDLDTGVYPEDAYTPEAQNDSAYFAYRYQSDTLFPVPERNSDLKTKEQVFGLAFGDEARAYPLSLFEGNNLINDTLASQKVVTFAGASGAGVRAYERGGHVFTLAEASVADGQSVILTDESGGKWRPVDNALASLNGSGLTLQQVASRDAYWFGWYVFYPHMDICSPYPLPPSALVLCLDCAIYPLFGGVYN